MTFQTITECFDGSTGEGKAGMDLTVNQAAPLTFLAHPSFFLDLTVTSHSQRVLEKSNSYHLRVITSLTFE